jgi:adenylate kinase
MCKNGHVFHVATKPSKVEGVCDVCGEPLYQRADDNEETVQTRLNAYNESTAKLIDYYNDKGVLRKVDGNQPIDAVSEAMLAVIDAEL